MAYSCRLLVISSSVFNPVIYTVRKREFRVACIEFLLRKSLQDAEEFDTTLFGSRTNAVRPQITREGEEGEEKIEERNTAHANNNLKHNPEVLTSGGYYDENSFPTQNETLSSDGLTCPSESAREEHLAHHKIKQEDNAEVLASGVNRDKHTFSLRKEPLSSNAATHPFETTREEHDEKRNPAHDNNKQEETPDLLTSRANPDENTFPLQKESLTLTDAFTHPSKSKREERCEKGNPAYDKTKQEDNLEVNFPGSVVCLEPT